MTPEQKQRAMQMLRRFSQATPMTRTADNAAVAMAALLQELVDAPEPEPVAKVTGYYGGYLSIATIDGRVLPAGTALYLAPPAPTPAEPPADLVQDSVASEPVGYLYTNLQSGEYHVSDADDDYRGPERVLWCIEPVYRRAKGQQA
jgi:hypothetical protein